MAEKKTKVRLAELHNLSESDLDKTIEDARREIYTIKRQRLSKPVEDVKATRNARKEIARVLTIKRQREIAAAAAK